MAKSIVEGETTKKKGGKPKGELNPRQIKLNNLKNNTSISVIKRELNEAIDKWSSDDHDKLRAMYYMFKMWTLDKEDPKKKTRTLLDSAINQTKIQIERNKKLGMSTDRLEEELKEYKAKLKDL